MNFDSPEFLVFLPAVVLAYALLAGRLRSRHALLLAASYLFYMSWSWRYAGLIAFSTLLDYAIALRLGREERTRSRHLLLLASLVVNLGLLGLFKYFNFFADSADGLVHWLGLDWELPHHQLLLPVGISFYTFQTLSYTIDVYWRRLEPERDLVRFALFVSFFPQLVAGPIVRAADFLPQLRADRDATAERVRWGLARIFRGLAKKVLVADLLASLAVDRVFAEPEAFGSLGLALALYAYAFQIYADFSGYSDIAIGAAALLGFRIPENFDRPYRARNVREFWTRWHISLSTWLRDYLYIPLGGNRGDKLRTARNLLLTMGLGGLWHGAAWNFVLWGVYHGVLLVLARGIARGGAPASAARVWFERAVCFHLVLFGWLLFRTTD
ncbi:MAG TPA: MBOAT family O-acyltransferase, partial [Planctomycetota bacterium]|nr:MBOAT family O-acyltransferase [Planctomycetota bacterium]